MAAAQLATQGYRIAKSWQYQENLPDPTQTTGAVGDNNNSFFVSTSLNPARSATGPKTEVPKKLFGIFPNIFETEKQLGGADRHLQKPLLGSDPGRNRNASR